MKRLFGFRIPSRAAHHRRPGIVLVLCLSMLSLFSVLVAGYVIFTSQAVSVAAIEHRDELPVNEALKQAMTQLISGTGDHKSVAYQQSLMEDMYGRDFLTLRVANRRRGAAGTGGAVITADGYDSRVSMLKNSADMVLVKFPTSLVGWQFDGNQLPEGTDVAIPAGLPADSIYVTQDIELDDVFTGRYLTFLEGPLANFTAPILRSFSTTAADKRLAGNFVLDIGQYTGNPNVEINQTPYDVLTVAGSQPASLFYDAGSDGGPGVKGVDDDKDGTTDENDELGTPGSDDFGYRFVVNGAMFNGRGSNPEGDNEIYRTVRAKPVETANASQLVDKDFVYPELQYNRRLIGPNDTGERGVPPVDINATTKATLDRRPEPDEGWDAPDFENLFLAWQPSDHRAVIDSSIYNGASNANELHQTLGSNLIPSFHRPSVINYLMNQPILVNGVSRRFRQIDGSDGGDERRLAILLTRLRRAVMRPLNVDSSVSLDLDDNGQIDDGALGFTGSNPSPFAQLPILPADNFTERRSKIQRLAVFLANGPWDVDNDDDGLPDSIWVDFNLPVYTTAEGSLIKPLIAPLVEDFDGRININHAGNVGQQLVTKFPQTYPATGSGGNAIAAARALNFFGRGGGLGPAEIDFSHLFVEPAKATSNGPLPWDQTDAKRTTSDLLLTKYGNILSTRYQKDKSNAPFPYLVPPTAPTATNVKMPGVGTLGLGGVDSQGRIPHPARRTGQNDNAPMGTLMDMYGVAMSRPDRNGQTVLTDAIGTSPPAAMNELDNQPYESNDGEDAFYEGSEFVELIQDPDPGRTDRLHELLVGELSRNAALASLIGIDSRSVEAPEMTNHGHFLTFVRQKVLAAGTALDQTNADRMVAPELRKGGKLNLNRQLGNGDNDNGDAAGMTDETVEVFAQNNALVSRREAAESAYPALPSGETYAHVNQKGNYQPISSRPAPAANPIDFDGRDTTGDGTVDSGSSIYSGRRERIPNGQELLARHLYCLMFFLVGDPKATAADEIIPGFPYPTGFTTNIPVRNNYAAHRLAQWAVNAVDARDTDAICTRLRYDPNPLNGFDMSEAAARVVWGMERPEVEITETLAFHDKGLRRNIETSVSGVDGLEQSDDEADVAGGKTPDKDMDQFRIPRGSAFVELHSLRTPGGFSGTANGNRPSFPAELYRNDKLDLGRMVGAKTKRTPVWRLAVGAAIRGDANKSIRWLYDAPRVGELHAGQTVGGSVAADQIDYLSLNNPDWTKPALVKTKVQQWRETTQGAEVRTILDGTDKTISLADDDFDPSNDGSGPHTIELKRFVLFTDLSKADFDALDIMSDPRSAMNRRNVFFKQRRGPTGGVDDQDSLLAPGQYAVVAPRVLTVMGQEKLTPVTAAEYEPSKQQIELAPLTGTTSIFKLLYRDLSGNDLIPRYADYSGSIKANDYNVGGILPIIAEAYQPNDPALPAANRDTAWNPYTSKVAVGEQVHIGFNISEPLTGQDTVTGERYYTPPTDKVSKTAGPGGQIYPLVDGYRDTEDASDKDYFYDDPFDHESGTGKPLTDNSWAPVGTYQEAVGIFLQRLADPTRVWDPIDNPYLTVDLAPMDLTTFNGDDDADKKVDHDKEPSTDPRSVEYTINGNSDTPPQEMRFDSRRKIPDTSRDRPMVDIVQINGPDDTDISNYRNELTTQRPFQSASFSVLRLSAAAKPVSHFGHELGAMWGTSPKYEPTDGPIDSRYKVNGTWKIDVLDKPAGSVVRTDYYHPQMDVEPYRQTLGFVNREYGRPLGATAGDVTSTTLGSDPPNLARLGRSTPSQTRFLFPEWNDRDFRSPLELMDVAASSATGILSQMTLGTEIKNPTATNVEEVPRSFGHLLGFAQKIGRKGGVTSTSLDTVVPAKRSVLSDSKPDVNLTSDSAPFELIFDAVSTGEPRYADNRWLDPAAVKFEAGAGARIELFNRAVEFLQPPYNYMPGHRTPGRINLNTTPDYLRAGGAYNFNNTDSDAATNEYAFLDFDERNNSTGAGSRRVAATTPSDSQTSLSTGSVSATGTFGNGSIHRSYAWGGSTVYDLANGSEPTVTGTANNYRPQSDSIFGLGFKAFIESRRGYPTVDNSNVSLPLSAPGVGLLNPNLDQRYPTQFAGVFGSAAAAGTPSVQRFMRPLVDNTGIPVAEGVLRRTDDMTVLRSHPDFDERLAVDTGAGTGDKFDDFDDALASLAVESGVSGTAPYNNLQMTKGPEGVFERSIAELHQSYRHLARDSTHRFENARRMKNLTTHHSNVFLTRMTVGFFVVDRYGNPSVEYADPDGVITRGRATFVIDRSKPVGFTPGVPMNSDETKVFEQYEN